MVMITMEVYNRIGARPAVIDCLAIVKISAVKEKSLDKVHLISQEVSRAG